MNKETNQPPYVSDDFQIGPDGAYEHNETIQIIDEAYKNYSKEYEKDNSIGLTLLVQMVDGRSVYRKPDKEMFVAMCTYDKNFSEKWGLKIEERELSESERVQIYYKKHNKGRVGNKITKFILDNDNISTKLITITYNNERIESYE